MFILWNVWRVVRLFLFFKNLNIFVMLLVRDFIMIEWWDMDLLLGIWILLLIILFGWVVNIMFFLVIVLLYVCLVNILVKWFWVIFVCVIVFSMVLEFWFFIVCLNCCKFCWNWLIVVSIVCWLVMKMLCYIVGLLEVIWVKFLKLSVV